MGPHLLVAPVMEQGATAREIYLPALPHNSDAHWYDFYTKTPYKAGQVSAPLSFITRIEILAETLMPPQ